MCYVVCKQRYNYKMCGCYDADVDCFSCCYKNFCVNPEDLKCIQNYSSYVNSECNDRCYPECKEQRYSYSLSTRKFPSETYKLKFVEKSKLLKEIISNDYQEIEDKILRIVVYSDDFDYEYVSESKSVQIENFIANIGGTLGLFLGISVLSLCEIFEILFEFIFYLNKERKKNLSIQNGKIVLKYF